MGRATNRTSRCPTHRRSPPKALAQPTPWLRRCDSGGLRTQGRAFRPVLMCWRGRRNTTAQNGTLGTRPAARQQMTEAAATTQQRLPARHRQKGGEGRLCGAPVSKHEHRGARLSRHALVLLPRSDGGEAAATMPRYNSYCWPICPIMLKVVCMSPAITTPRASREGTLLCPGNKKLIW